MLLVCVSVDIISFFLLLSILDYFLLCRLDSIPTEYPWMDGTVKGFLLLIFKVIKTYLFYNKHERQTR